MKKLNQVNAKGYALDKFKELPDLNYQWNLIHSEGIIEILNILIKNDEFNKEKLFALAWIHDIGKIKSEENHAEIGFDILRKDFELDEIDKDCILNHGSSSVPKTKEGRIFRYADGLSLFVPKTIKFRFYAESKEGMSLKEIQDDIKKMYSKYLEKYLDSEEVVSLLKRLFEGVNLLK
jgi:HD superfamily phosphodiesterase